MKRFSANKCNFDADSLPFSGMRAAVNVKHFTCDECCIVEIHHRINDLIDFAHSADRLKTLQKIMGLRFRASAFL